MVRLSSSTVGVLVPPALTRFRAIDQLDRIVLGSAQRFCSKHPSSSSRSCMWSLAAPKWVQAATPPRKHLEMMRSAERKNWEGKAWEPGGKVSAWYKVHRHPRRPPSPLSPNKASPFRAAWLHGVHLVVKSVHRRQAAQASTITPPFEPTFTPVSKVAESTRYAWYHPTGWTRQWQLPACPSEGAEGTHSWHLGESPPLTSIGP